MDRRGDLERLYELLSRLEDGLDGKRTLGGCDGRMDWPDRGLYLFFEPGETRDDGTPRIVRVGTHGVSEGSRSTLWKRLRQHRGTTSGGGNHRGSVFRLLVGRALINRDGLDFPDWGEGSHAPAEVREEEEELEEKVSEHLGDMDLLWLRVGDGPGPDSDRAYLERNIIALLCNGDGPLDAPGGEWLGNHSHKREVRESGLWNVEHVGEDYDPRFLDILERYVEVTLGNESHPEGSLAPETERGQVRLDDF